MHVPGDKEGARDCLSWEELLDWTFGGSQLSEKLMIARGRYGLPKTPGMGVHGDLCTNGATYHPSTKLGVADPGYLSFLRLHLSAMAREATARYTATITAEDAKRTPSAANVAAAAAADARLRAAEQLRGQLREAAHVKADDLLFQGALTYLTSLAHRVPLTVFINKSAQS